MRIGILGGSFDPIHNGHLYMAKQSREAYALDEVWLVPAGRSPNKDSEKMTDAADRLRMAQLAAKAYPYLKASSVEVDSPGVSYTFRTLERLHRSYPQEEFFFLMGADSLDYFDRWVHPERICHFAKILVINRDDFRLSDIRRKIERIQSLFAADIRTVSCDKYDISSSEIRDRIARGEDCGAFLPPPVEDYIREHHLYQTGDDSRFYRR